MPPAANTPTPVRKQSKRRSNLFTVSGAPPGGPGAAQSLEGVSGVGPTCVEVGELGQTRRLGGWAGGRAFLGPRRVPARVPDVAEGGSTPRQLWSCGSLGPSQTPAALAARADGALHLAFPGREPPPPGPRRAALPSQVRAR